MAKKYVLNIGTNKYHIIGGCQHSKCFVKDTDNMKGYDTEEEIIAEHQYYVSKCKICFRNK